MVSVNVTEKLACMINELKTERRNQETLALIGNALAASLEVKDFLEPEQAWFLTTALTEFHKMVTEVAKS